MKEDYSEGKERDGQLDIVVNGAIGSTNLPWKAENQEKEEEDYPQ